MYTTRIPRTLASALNFFTFDNILKMLATPGGIQEIREMLRIFGAWKPPNLPSVYIIQYRSIGIGRSWLNLPSDSKACWLRGVWSRHLFWTGAGCNQIYLQDLMVAFCLGKFGHLFSLMHYGCHLHIPWCPWCQQELRRVCHSSGHTCGLWRVGQVWFFFCSHAAFKHVEVIADHEIMI